MKKLIYAIILLTGFCFGSAGITIASTPLPVFQKVKHPTQAMPDTQADAILKQMQKKNTDAEKIDVLKAGVKDQGITVEQLTILLNQFLTDDSKLTCAEFAYAFTVNYKTYIKINSLFSSEKYKEDLEDYIHQHK